MAYTPTTQLPIAVVKGGLFARYTKLTPEQQELLAAYNVLGKIAKEAVMRDANADGRDYITGANVDQARTNFRDMGAAEGEEKFASLDEDEDLMRGSV